MSFITGIKLLFSTIVIFFVISMLISITKILKNPQMTNLEIWRYIKPYLLIIIPSIMVFCIALLINLFI